MNSVSLKVAMVCALFLKLSSQHIYAQFPPNHRNEGQGYAFYTKSPIERGGQERNGQAPDPYSQSNSLRERKSILPDGSGFAMQGEGSAAASDYSGRQGKLSPEERRALRRQIDEAGHDIYSPQRKR